MRCSGDKVSKARSTARTSAPGFSISRRPHSPPGELLPVPLPRFAAPHPRRQHSPKPQVASHQRLMEMEQRTAPGAPSQRRRRRRRRRYGSKGIISGGRAAATATPRRGDPKSDAMPLAMLCTS
jgi:hypothetical protein